MESPQKVYPSAEELSTINSTVHCPEEGCASVFMSESNLNLHLAKTHKKETLTSSEAKEYHCPDLSCVYHNVKSFKALKLLKQHYLKVHCEKTIGCDSCDMKFATQSAKNSHVDYCNAKFTCCDCSSSYGCYETLVTHGRRKKHKILEKATYKTKVNNKIPIKSFSIANFIQKSKNIFILPKCSTSLQCVNYMIPNMGMVEKGSQTDIWTGKRRGNLKCVNNSQETQTLNKKHLTAETQTIGDYITKSPTITLSEDDLSRKSIKTQTKPIDSTTKSCNTCFNLNDFNFEIDDAQKNHSGTQTTGEISELLYSTPQNTYSIHTDTDDLNEFEFMHSSSQTSFNEDMDTFDSENYFNCNSETQTDLMSVLNTDYCTNMYTQTCDNLLLNELGFINSHTQTVFDDVLRSVESQTMILPQCKVALSCRDMAHMETQTDVEFKQMLEEINA